MTTLTRQQSATRNTTLETIPQKRFPLVHVLTSKSENDEDKVGEFSNEILFSLIFYSNI
jgi:hypothetical protein